MEKCLIFFPLLSLDSIDQRIPMKQDYLRIESGTDVLPSLPVLHQWNPPTVKTSDRFNFKLQILSFGTNSRFASFDQRPNCNISKKLYFCFLLHSSRCKEEEICCYLSLYSNLLEWTTFSSKRKLMWHLQTWKVLCCETLYFVCFDWMLWPPSPDYFILPQQVLLCWTWKAILATPVEGSSPH